METVKNLQATIPAALLERAEHITVDERVRDAVQRRLNTHEWRAPLAFGEKHAKSLGLTEADVATAIAEVRRDERGR